jgi:Cu/Ag efflux protein CusF
MHKSTLIAALIVAATASLNASAQTSGAVVDRQPGRVGIAQAVDVTATISGIDAAKREITLKGPDGKEVTMVAGPEVKNFSQLKVGDKVDIQYVEALVLELKKGGGLPVARTEKADLVTAKPGETPGAKGARQVTIVGDVINLDPTTQTVTLKGPERTAELKVRDKKQFDLISKGDQIEATYTEALAVAVKPSAKK